MAAAAPLQNSSCHSDVFLRSAVLNSASVLVNDMLQKSWCWHVVVLDEKMGGFYASVVYFEVQFLFSATDFTVWWIVLYCLLFCPVYSGDVVFVEEYVWVCSLGVSSADWLYHLFKERLKVALMSVLAQSLLIRTYVSLSSSVCRFLYKEHWEKFALM